MHRCEHHELNSLLTLAREGGKRLDTAPLQTGFEHRFLERLQNPPPEFGPAECFRMWFRALTGCAAAAGVIIALFLANHGGDETVDVLSAWWSGNSTSWDQQIFN